ncbi:hypothetical protein BDD43_4656 [Mucilaginibacter gracilis]|uniref:Uncharacterized protein n=1 Tax=Mucilaginibacter gracilis TaxID=423350 RepID=A0A495J6S9_9SPHI|nr:hypothetical protein [Mucilaginibacter gracilis]RKR84421.1 hypothetical protein BDD43_4656 [Mucilaginibacter gracilis]
MFELIENIHPDFPQIMKFVANPIGAPTALPGEPQIKLYNGSKEADACRELDNFSFKWFPLNDIIAWNKYGFRKRPITPKFSANKKYILPLIIGEYDSVPRYGFCRTDYIELAIAPPVKEKKKRAPQKRDSKKLQD